MKFFNVLSLAFNLSGSHFQCTQKQADPYYEANFAILVKYFQDKGVESKAEAEDKVQRIIDDELNTLWDLGYFNKRAPDALRDYVRRRGLQTASELPEMGMFQA